MKIIVPMAGRGSRLRPHTLTVPKPLVPIAGKPIVQRLVEDITRVCGQKVGEIAFVIGDFGAAVEAELLEIAKNLNCSSQKCIAYKSDASKLDQCENLVESFLNDFETIDVLINNAGITKDNLLMRMGEDDFDKVMEVNLKSVFNMTKACQRVFLKNRKGSIINMSSVVGVKGNAGQSNYAASKAGIIGFSKSIAQELGSRSIRCNVIAPGFIKTEMTDNLSDSIIESWTENIPLKRPGK